MTERVAQANATPGAASSPPDTLKHCWVNDQHGRLPALLLQWRRTVDGYQGRVVHPVQEADGSWIVVDEWLPAVQLEPA
jgi:hypothetical protein